MKNYEDYLQDCDDECENENRHNMVGLAPDLLDALRPFIRDEDFAKIAKRIKGCILKHL